jgi:hypothetical protein
MERITSRARPRCMINQRRIRGLATAGLLCAALAGCGTAAAATVAGTAARSAMPTAAPKVGCASVDQSTKVTVVRNPLVRQPPSMSVPTVTQRNVALVRALFGDICAAVNHPVIRPPLHLCPADFGIFYSGTFYRGQRVLATFTYEPSGCPRVSISAAGKTKGTLLLGSAAVAAPHFKADLAAVLGVRVSQV